MRLPWRFMQIEPDLYAIVDRDDETVMTLDWDWDHRHDAVQDMVEMANTTQAALVAALAGLMDVSGMDHPATESVRDALAKARGGGGGDG